MVNPCRSRRLSQSAPYECAPQWASGKEDAVPYRDAKSGKYITKTQADRKPSQSVKETDKKKK